MPVLFEFEDLRWFPTSIRQGMTDYLGILLRTIAFYQPVYPILNQVLAKSGTNLVTDVCSGNGGPAVGFLESLEPEHSIRIHLSDKYPNLPAWQELRSDYPKNIGFIPEPVDIENLPGGLSGVLTMFSAAHHFDSGALIRFLKAAVLRKQPVLLFDSGDRNLLAILGIVCIHPLIFLLCTPFFKPFRWDRLVFTYLVPLIPICTIWDGVISILRLHRKGAFNRMADSADGQGRYVWEEGYVRNRFGFKVHYLVGVPGGNQVSQ